MSDKKRVLLLSNDIELHRSFEDVKIFSDVTIITDLGAGFKSDILIVSDRLLPVNRFIDFYSNSGSQFVYAFYMLSSNSDNNKKQVTALLKSKGVIVIPPKLTSKQIVDKVLSTIGESVIRYRNVFGFFGADGKVGTTQITQCVAEMLAVNTKTSICFINFSEQPINYFNNPEIKGLDIIKAKVVNKILTVDELVDSMYQKDNLYMLSTTTSIPEMRYYHPEHVEYIIMLAAQRFSIVLLDAGYNPNSGMYIGALNITNNRFLITTQQDNAKVYFDLVNEQVLQAHDITPMDFLLIVNKCLQQQELYSPTQLAELYNATLCGAVPYSEYGWQAERDKKALLTYDDSDFNFQIGDISKQIATQLDIDFEELPQKKKGFLSKFFS